ncbi:RagB/SusD family nutrient uptake outer membrane protein [Fulvivirgaceae bacterium PWU4]|uniref:RagB/SusD family nutrient uptake outer membrane protein n=1 Tax=Chryseosolibacter histidini TaxID=2782349 RepID=A0AAP2DK89_9BACT|nr:RagB/SusD family nutrient uptake outer membrane protein [Chryseosolibacter histidini]MBT1697921.1 RagB/SusD family nutrient uptake outer membrane protein [Chryseosolibacter histidini]
MKLILFNNARGKHQGKGGSITVILLFMLTCCVACAEFLNIDEPKNQVVGGAAYKDDASATSAIIGIYTKIMEAPAFASGSITLHAGFSADEINQSNVNGFQTNSLLPTDPELKSSLWEPGYKYIYYANSLLEGISTSSNVSLGVRRKLEGEAKFIRAFSFFYLTNLFGDVPLVTTTDYKINEMFHRTPQAEVYEQIVSDLLDAEGLLPADYSIYGNERIRPNKSAATALLARVYLFRNRWSEAEAAATSVINNTELYSLQDSVYEVFLAKVKQQPNREALWQLAPVSISYTFEKQLFNFDSQNLTSSNLLCGSAVNAFEAGDKRKKYWIGSAVVDKRSYFFPSKYKAGDNASEAAKEYSMVLRLAEQYLIRAEARAQQNKLAEAIADVDTIRHRAGLPLIQNTNPGIGKEELILAIMQERRVEFMAEWGHRWLDLKRTLRADAVLSSVKADWQPTDVLYPIPQSEIDNNPNLQPQNEGY